MDQCYVATDWRSGDSRLVLADPKAHALPPGGPSFRHSPHRAKGVVGTLTRPSNPMKCLRSCQEM